MVGVVAERDRIDAAREELIGGLWRDSQATCDVLAVDHHERRIEALAQQGQAFEQGTPPDPADEIADEQDPHRTIGFVRAAALRARGLARRPAASRRTCGGVPARDFLLLSHTSPMR